MSLFKLISPFVPQKVNSFFYRFPVNRKVKIKLNGARPFIMVNEGSDSIANEIFWKGLKAYEPQTENIIIKLLQKTDVFFDIGANTGLYSLIAASQTHNIYVHAFEPVDSAYDLFNSSINASGFRNITINKLALSNFDGESTFNLQMPGSPKIPLGSSLRQDMGDQQNKKIIKVKTFKLDTSVKLYDVNKIDLMKIDTEGTEDLVIEGGQDTINKFRPVIICEVLSNLLEERLHNLMDYKNYHYYYVEKDMLQQCEKIVGDPYIVSNYLFMPVEKENTFLTGIRKEKIEKKVFSK